MTEPRRSFEPAMEMLLMATLFVGILIVARDCQQAVIDAGLLYSARTTGRGILQDIQPWLQECRRKLLSAVSTFDSDRRVSFIDESLDAEGRVDTLLGASLRLKLRPGQLETAHGLEAQWTQYRATSDTIRSLMRQGRFEEAADLEQAQGEHSFEQVSTVFRRFKDQLDEYVDQQSHQVVTSTCQAGGELILCLAVFPVVIKARSRVRTLRILNRDLARAQMAAGTASEMKSEFLTNMSHEIRTPLNGVLGMIGPVLDTELSDEQREYVQAAYSSAEVLLSAIGGVLDFSSVDSGQVALEVTRLEPGNVVKSVAEAVAYDADKKGLELTTQVCPGVPDAIEGDPARLRHVVLNLLTNAIRFTPAGEIRLTIQCISRNQLRFEVTDSGVGVPEDAQSGLFLPGRSGLSVCKRLVDLMGGQIGVESEPGHGSTFWFMIPFDPDRSETVRKKSMDYAVRKYSPLRSDNHTCTTIPATEPSLQRVNG